MRRVVLLLMIPVVSGCVAGASFEETTAGTVLAGERGGVLFHKPVNRDVEIHVSSTGTLLAVVLPADERGAFLSWKTTSQVPTLDMGKWERVDLEPGLFLVGLQCERPEVERGRLIHQGNVTAVEMERRLDDCHYRVGIRQVAPTKAT